MTPRIGSLFSGYGGLDLAVEEVLGGETVWHCEVEPAPSKILAARWPGVPNLGDVTAVDWANVEPVDVICGGSPCQDVSAAGKRAGMRAGTRSGLWASMCDAIDIIRPRLVVWENVRGVLSAEADSALEPCPGCVGDGDDGAVLRALGRVLGDLADIGYDASWYGLRAADVGAPHGRFRVFVVAHAGRSDRWGEVAGGRGAGGVNRVAGGRDEGSGASVGRGRTLTDTSVGGSQGRPDLCARQPDTARRYGTAADAAHVGHERGRPARGRRDGSTDSGHAPADTYDAADDSERPRPQPRDGNEGAAADATGRSGSHQPVSGNQGRQQERPITRTGSGDRARGTAARVRDVGGTSPVVAWGQYEPAIRRWESTLGRVAPAPTDLAPKGGQRLSPRFVEWMMGLPAGWVTDVPGISRNDQLKALGNGVVPQQAAAALRHLLATSSLAA